VKKKRELLLKPTYKQQLIGSLKSLNQYFQILEVITTRVKKMRELLLKNIYVK